MKRKVKSWQIDFCLALIYNDDNIKRRNERNLYL